MIKEHKLSATEKSEIEKIIDELQKRDLIEMAAKCADHYRVSICEMVGRSNLSAYCKARALFWAVLYSEGCWSYPRIGYLMRRDQSTIRSAVINVPCHLVAEITRKSIVPVGHACCGCDPKIQSGSDPLHVDGGQTQCCSSDSGRAA